MNIKPSVDNRAPAKRQHMRPNNFKEQLFQQRERKIENNILVSKILQAKVNIAL